MRCFGRRQLLRRGRFWLAVGCLGVLAYAIAGAGCASVAEFAVAVGTATGAIDAGDSTTIMQGLTVVNKAFEDITPQQEHYIGRAVAADILAQYPPLDNPAANEYLNLLGQSLARYSDRPETFDGYHFLLLDSDEINAFAAPGGLVMVTRGLVRLCHSEDALAAVLAHEIGHVALGHGLGAISNSRRTELATFALTEGAARLGSDDLKKHVTQFKGTIEDVTKDLVVNGYDRKREYEADTSAVATLKRVGYNPAALVDMLGEMQKGWKTGGLGFMKTHPTPVDRINEVRPHVAAFGRVDEPSGRHARFVAAMGAL